MQGLDTFGGRRMPMEKEEEREMRAEKGERERRAISLPARGWFDGQRAAACGWRETGWRRRRAGGGSATEATKGVEGEIWEASEREREREREKGARDARWGGT